MAAEISLLLKQLALQEHQLESVRFACQPSEPNDSVLMIRCLFSSNDSSKSHSNCLEQTIFGYVSHIHQQTRSDQQKILDIRYEKQEVVIELHSQQSILEILNIARRGPRTASFILQSLKDLSLRPEDQLTACLLTRALISTTCDLLDNPATTLNRNQTLFEQMRNYIEVHYQQDISRETLAEQFYISPNYVSHVFQREAEMRFQEYLTHIRLEHAKDMLRQYDLKIKDIARRCGFNDSNYFCKLFKEKTERSPTEYRVHYQGQQGR